MPAYHAAVLAVCILAATTQQPQFTDVTGASGIHSLKYAEGVSMSDLDNDGLPELYLPCVKGKGRLYSNLGKLKFSDVTAKSGVTVSGGIGAVIGDLDRDGRKDIYVVRGAYPYGLNVLYAGRDGMTFEDVTEKAGLASRKNGISAVLADYDADSDLDILVANWGRNTLYRNTGAPGRFAFEDVSVKAGLGAEGRSWAAVSSDFNGDGSPDFFTCQGGPGTTDTSRLYVKTGATFRDVTAASGLGGVSSMGAVSADFDSDGDIDLFVTSFEGPDRLFLNDGNGRFADATQGSGIATRKSVGVAAGCIDGDLLPDLVVAGFAGPVIVYRNIGGGKFSEMASGVASQAKNEGVALGDLDGDGDLDLYAANYDGKNALYRNNLDSPLYIKITSAHGGGLSGATARLYRPGGAGEPGALLATAECQAGYGFCSQSPEEVIFRLPSKATYDLVVVFPGGAVTTLKGIGPGVQKIVRPKSRQ